MSEDVKAIIGLVGTTIALVFTKNIWEDRKHKREVKLESKIKDLKIEELTKKLDVAAENEAKHIKKNKSLEASNTRLKKLLK